MAEGPEANHLKIHTTPRPQPECATSKRIQSSPILVCPIGRGWLKDWKEIGIYCGFGGKKGTSAYRTGRKWERLYNLPVHRLPDGSVRAIPYELDQWLIAFSKELANVEERKPSDPIKRSWRAGSADRTEPSISGVGGSGS